MNRSLRQTENLALLAHHLKVSLEAGLTPSKALSNLRHDPFPHRIRAALEEACIAAHHGQALSESLRPAKNHLPAFTLPFLAAGEASGQSADSFHFLDLLCQRLLPVQRMAQQIGMIPTVIIGFGILTRIAIMLAFGATDEAAQAVAEIGIWLCSILLIIGWLKRTATGNLALDYLSASIPYLGNVVRSINHGLFFQSFNFVYRSGGQDAETLFKQSLETVPNRYLRNDLQRALEAIRNNQTLSEAFLSLQLVAPGIRETLSQGAYVGRLEQSLNAATDRLAETMAAQLQFTRLILARLLGLAVTASILGTILILSFR